MKKVFAIKLRRLGDTILWTAALQALRDFFPKAEIILGVPREYLPLMDGDPRFQRVIPLSGSWREDREKVQTLAPDVALVFHASSYSRAVARASHPKTLVVHHHSRRPRRFGSELPVPNLGVPMSAVERDLNTVRALGWSGNAPTTHLSKFQNPPSENRTVVLGIGASRPAKEWPFERWVQVAEEWSNKGKVIALAQSWSRYRQYGPWMRRLEAVAEIVETPGLLQAVEVLQRAQVFSGNDSGLKHLAAALDLKTVTLFGPESIGEWQCYSPPRHRALQVNVACRTHDPVPKEFSWCGALHCPLSSHACMTGIRSADVIRAIEAVI